MTLSATFREIQVLHHLANNQLATRAVPDVLADLAAAAARLLPADRVSIIGFNVGKQSIDYFAAAGPGREAVVTSVDYDELWQGLSGWALREGRAVLSSKEGPDERESADAQVRRRETNCGCILVVPVRNHEKDLGTITAINRPDQRNFGRKDLFILSAFAASIAVLIENAKLLASLQLSLDVSEALREVSVEQSVMKDKLFTILAHDLRGPVGSLKTLLDVAAETPLEPEDALEVIRTARKSAGQTYDLLDNLLGWIRSQIEEVKVLRGRFLLNKSLLQVTSWMEPQARAKNLQLRCECPDDLSVEGDERMVETIVRNFVSNAVKYSYPGNAILIRALRPGEVVAVEVQDRGAGMPPEKVETLFTRHTSSERGTGGEPGNGLGLMFCADLARSLGGRLEVESRVGEGSTFRLVLPDPVENEL